MNLSLLPSLRFLVGLTLIAGASGATKIFIDIGLGTCQDSNRADYASVAQTGIATLDACKALCSGTDVANQPNMVGIEYTAVSDICRCLLQNVGGLVFPSCCGAAPVPFSSGESPGGSFVGVGQPVFSTLAAAIQCIAAFEVPSSSPSMKPSQVPSSKPSQVPSIKPSLKPSQVPSSKPSQVPSKKPSGQPTLSEAPSAKPSQVPSSKPSLKPSQVPSGKPSISNSPSKRPTPQPTIGSKNNGKPRGPGGADLSLIKPTAKPSTLSPVTTVPFFGAVTPIAVPVAATPVGVPVAVPVMISVVAPVSGTGTGKAPKAGKKAKSPSASKGAKLVASKAGKRHL